MDISKTNSLVELFFDRLEKTDEKKPFLTWLKNKDYQFSWGEVSEKIFKLSNKIRSLIQ